MSNAAHAVIFDLDGTLLDTLADIANASNRVLEQLSLPTHPVERYRDFIGSGVSVLFERAAPGDSSAGLIADCVARFAVTYADCWHDRTELFPGVRDLLDELIARRIPLGILSNKPHGFTVQCCDQFFPERPFQRIYGQREGFPRKPDPTVALVLAKELGVAGRGVLYVGDSPVDMQTATAAGFQPLGVDWGFRPPGELIEHGAEVILSQPLQLLDRLEDD